MRSTYRSTAGALLSVALLCGTAACSGGGESKAGPAAKGSASQAPQKAADATAAAAVKRAARKSEEITSLSYSMSGKMPGTGDVDGTAAIRMNPQAMQMKMKIKGATAEGSGQMEMRVVDGALYMRGSDETMGGDAKWIKFDMGAMQAAGGADGKGKVGSQPSNPADEASGMGSAKDVTKVGEETIDGVKTTHYTGTVTLGQLRQELQSKPADVRERQEKNLAEYEKMGADKIQIDMWVDGEDHGKQVRTRSATRKGQLDMTMKFLDVNKPVTVETPPASEVTDLAELAKKMKDLQDAKGPGSAA
ncbi:DUF1396 domain-containing protein [Streptomyces sp. UNOC14_S4]|uniref:DUF1396 domain-containing protein n=1 Tax=Streptomyces sp. UNOC14_S4 TaxID=2872340 RepID=UPI001E6451F3|nr:DUF1396 domain-containing protein [Streptomyces sp. UNOC14_S4]MCC3766230.1 DUF1396 domain-containing protein [Streptomyces sp. UNOC14_S4]